MESTGTKKEDEYKYQLFSSTSFKKDYKKFLNDKVKIAKIDDTIKQLRIGGVEQFAKNWRGETIAESSFFNRKLQRTFRMSYRARFTHYLATI